MVEAVMCIALAVYFESRGESQAGQLAVAQVIMNRVEHEAYPDDPCAVVKQGRYWRHIPLRHQCQFSFWCDGLPERIEDREAWGMAVLNGAVVYWGWLPDYTKGATHYHAAWVRPQWSSRMEQTVRVDNHVFYRQKKPR